MSLSRLCSRNACRRPAVATLTYVYADSMAVVGPLATHAEPHTYDLCRDHAANLTAPRGWDIVRLAGDYPEQPAMADDDDDLLAIADALREPRPATRPVTAAASVVAQPVPVRASPTVREVGRRGHLRVLTDGDA